MTPLQNNVPLLSLQQAYRAMYCFVEQYQERGQSEDLFLMLHAMRLEDDDNTSDPASWYDWMKCVRATLGVVGDE